MTRYHSHIISVLAASSMVLCVFCTRDYGKIKTEEELFEIYGKADESDTIILKPNEDISLYEYQGGLYDLIPEKDSVVVYEMRYEKGHKHQVIWYVKMDADTINVCDELSWDDRKISY